MNTCPSCGNEISSDMMYCPKCGNKLETICPPCNHINKAGANYCVKCGTKLRNSLEIGNNLEVGDIINFGNYFINDNKTKEPIEWRVLEVLNNKALLITKNAIDCKPYNNENVAITWENCSLRKWLNNEFINQAFSKEEQNKILLTNISNPNNPLFGTDGGNNTQDKIFLLSIDEEKKYFKDDRDRECKVTNFAKQQGAWFSYDNRYLDNCSWWLRSPGYEQHHAAYVVDNGIICDVGDYVGDDGYAVRPALFINL